MMQASELILLINTAVTFIMVGIIWFVQIVHYPLFGEVGQENSTRYQLAHMQRTSQVVLLPMFVEMVTAGLLILERPDSIPFWQTALGFGVVLALWLLTIILTVPKHNVLTSRYDAPTVAALIRVNWLRTILWTGRGLLVLWMLAQVLGR